MPYNVKHPLSLVFIRWFLFHLLSYLHRLTLKSKFCIVYGNFKVVSFIAALGWQLGAFETSLWYKNVLHADRRLQLLLNCHANRVAPFVLFGFPNSLPRFPPVDYHHVPLIWNIFTLNRNIIYKYQIFHVNIEICTNETGSSLLK